MYNSTQGISLCWCQYVYVCLYRMCVFVASASFYYHFTPLCNKCTLNMPCYSCCGFVVEQLWKVLLKYRLTVRGSRLGLLKAPSKTFTAWQPQATIVAHNGKVGFYYLIVAHSFCSYLLGLPSYTQNIFRVSYCVVLLSALCKLRHSAKF